MNIKVTSYVLFNKLYHLVVNFIFQEKFACAHSSKTATFNLNEHITDELVKLYSAYESRKDTWRAVGYQKAITAIKNYPKKIETWEVKIYLV